jgi:cell division protein FtsL
MKTTEKVTKLIIFAVLGILLFFNIYNLVKIEKSNADIAEIELRYLQSKEELLLYKQEINKNIYTIKGEIKEIKEMIKDGGQ